MKQIHIECAWCGLVMVEGDRTQPTSHGACPSCAAKLLAEWDREDAQ